MEAQADGLRCSILLLSNDGKHLRHGAAPIYRSLIVKQWTAHHWTRVGYVERDVLKRPVVVTDVLTIRSG